MAASRNTVSTPPADTAASLRDREHALRNELFALTLRTDLASEEVAQRRDELTRRLARAQEQIARAERLMSRARARLRAT